MRRENSGLAPLAYARGSACLIGMVFAAVALADSEAVVTPHLPDAVINKNYSFQLAAAPGQSPGWSVAQRALPDGLALSATGVISGTASTLGSNSFLIAATDPVFGVAYQALTLDVTLGPLNIANESLPIATQGVPYSVTLAGVGGVPPYKWSFATTVTQGMALDPVSGALTGAPTVAGSLSIPIQVTDSLGRTFSRGYSFFVATPLTVLTSALPNAAPGAVYSQTLTAGGGQAPYAWSASGLPMGLAMNSATGVISGTPAANGTSTVNIGVTDYGQRDAARAVLLTVGAGVVITNTSLAMGMIGTPYSQTLVASGGQAPYTWSISVGGSLPPGLTLNSTTGVIGGTPLYGSSLTFSVKATDSLGLTALATYTINVLPQLTITSLSLPPAPVGAVYSQAIAATGGETPYRWSATNLPAGLLLNASTGVIAGTPAGEGSTTISVTVTDALNHSATQALLLTTATSPIPAVTIHGLPTSTGYLQQPSITVSLASATATALSGTLAVSFVSSVGGTDQMIAFSNSSGQSAGSAAFTIPAGATQAQFSGASSVTLITGTVAGTITLTATIGTNVTTATLTNTPTVPFISRVTLSQTPGGVTVVVNGFSSSRDMTSGLFHFAPATNATITTNDLTVPLSSAFTTWYSSAASTQYGSEFTLTVPFAVANGAAANLVSATVTLTNSKGASNPVSPTQ